MIIKYNLEMVVEDSIYHEYDTLELKESLNLSLTDFKFSFEMKDKDIKVLPDIQLTDVQDVFSIINKDINSEEFLKIKYNIRLARIVDSNTIETDIVFENRKEVIFITIDELTGIISLITPEDFNNSNIINFTEEVLKVFYFVVKNEFLLTSNNVLINSTYNWDNVFSGFYNIALKQKTLENYLLTFNNDLLFYSNIPTTIKSSYNFKIDGQDLNLLNTKKNSIYILETSDQYVFYNSFNLSEFENNIAVIYYLEDNNTLSYFATVLTENLNEDFNFTNNFDISILNNADKEYQKRYLIQLYRIPIYTNENFLTNLHNNDFYDLIKTNYELYNSKVVII